MQSCLRVDVALVAPHFPVNNRSSGALTCGFAVRNSSETDLPVRTEEDKDWNRTSRSVLIHAYDSGLKWDTQISTSRSTLTLFRLF